ncbi:MAG: glycosyl transferase, partial [Proteobacteria bacterium]|nr:glycosyl transferase [Pseudomonadota bacterium]
HGRHDDLFTDYQAFNGATIRILTEQPLSLAEHARYFSRVTGSTVTQSGAVFHVLQGEGFNAQAYRQHVLQPAYALFHRIPDWLPVLDDPLARAVCGQPRCNPSPR